MGLILPPVEKCFISEGLNENATQHKVCQVDNQDYL